MIEFSKLIETTNDRKPGDKVIVTNNSSNHNYPINCEYTISDMYDSGQGFNGIAVIQYTLTDMQGVRGNSYITSTEFQKVDQISNKKIIIKDLENMLEFLKDYEGDIQNKKIDKEYKVYNILKQVKSTNSDFEKMRMISELI